MCRFRTCPDCIAVFGPVLGRPNKKPDVCQMIIDSGIAWTSIYGPGLYKHKEWRQGQGRLQEQERYDDLLTWCKLWQTESPYPRKWDAIIAAIERYLDGG